MLILYLKIAAFETLFSHDMMYLWHIIINESTAMYVDLFFNEMLHTFFLLGFLFYFPKSD